MTSQLTQADVTRLLQEPSPLIRAEIASKVAQDIDAVGLTDKELHLAQDIVRLMAKDVAVQVRQSLSQSLRHAAKLPHDVALKLAEDIESVALPMLENSSVLTDADLVAIVRQGSQIKQEAIAIRPNISETVSDVLITDAGERAVAKLMTNQSARITEQSLNKAISRFEDSESVKEAMVKREDLPITVAEHLVVMVSENLRDYLLAHHELSSGVASDLLMQSCERVLIGLTSGSSVGEIERLVAEMHAKKRLTPSIVIRALCMGEVTFFESAVAILANVPLLNARILLHDAGRLGLKTLYEKAGLPASLLPAVRSALDVLHETQIDDSPHALDRFRERVLERVLTQMEGEKSMSSDDMDYLLEKLSIFATTADDRAQA